MWFLSQGLRKMDLRLGNGSLWAGRHQTCLLIIGESELDFSLFEVEFLCRNLGTLREKWLIVQTLVKMFILDSASLSAFSCDPTNELTVGSKSVFCFYC